MSAVPLSLTTREVLSHLLEMDDPDDPAYRVSLDYMLQSARKAFNEFEREIKRTHPSGNMDYLRGAWHQAVRDLLGIGQTKNASLEADLLALAQELRDHWLKRFPETG